jgi:23S rRNA (pseudouridine1915-N3)-methyltransferase
MIKIYNSDVKTYKFEEVKEYSKGCWINMVNPSEKEIEMIKNKEGNKILKILPENSFKIALNLKGQMLSSEELAKKMLDTCTYVNSHLVFVIGGSLGLSNQVLSCMDYHLCFSKMTFPHQLMKVILLEQIYRGCKINNNESYHK